MPNSALVAKIHQFSESVGEAHLFQSDFYRSKLCDLIREIPKRYESQARDLCEQQVCPAADLIIRNLQADIDLHNENPEYAVVLYPLLRTAISIRAGELWAKQAPKQAD